MKYFFAENKFVFCYDVKGLLNALRCEYISTKSRLFRNSSKVSLECVLLNNRKKYASIPIGYSVMLKESLDAVNLILKKIKCNEHDWIICNDVKILCILLGKQNGYTKFPCFLCLWDSRVFQELETRAEVGNLRPLHDPNSKPFF